MFYFSNSKVDQAWACRANSVFFLKRSICLQILKLFKSSLSAARPRSDVNTVRGLLLFISGTHESHPLFFRPGRFFERSFLCIRKVVSTKWVPITPPFAPPCRLFSRVFLGDHTNYFNRDSLIKEKATHINKLDIGCGKRIFCKDSQLL